MKPRDLDESTAPVGTLLIVGTGVQWAGQATTAARLAIEGAQRVFFAVADAFTVRWIRDLAPTAEALPYPCDASDRIDTYLDMVERVMAAVRRGERVCAVFYGHPGVLCTPAHELLRAATREGHVARMLPGVSSLACLFADLAIDPGREGCAIFDASDWLLRPRAADPHTALILCQLALIGNASFYDPADRARIRLGLELLREALCRVFPRSHAVTIYEAAILPTAPPRVETAQIEQLAEVDVSALTTLYVPATARAVVDARARQRLIDQPEPETSDDERAQAHPRS